MKDDSLNDTHITRPGGYCPMCDTVYDKPHKCVGKQICTCAKDTCEYVNKDSVNYNNKSCKFIGIKSLRIVNIDKALETNVYERQIWNEAIEAAANLFPYGEWEEINIAAKIRKLKK